MPNLHTFHWRAKEHWFCKCYIVSWLFLLSQQLRNLKKQFHFFSAIRTKEINLEQIEQFCLPFPHSKLLKEKIFKIVPNE